MSDNTLTVTEVVNSVTVTPVTNTVTVSELGTQGPAGATGATGATGAQGSSGVVTVNAPLTNAGTSSAANLSVSTGTTSAEGVLQLTDSVSSTSTTTAATPSAVKTAYDLGAGRVPQAKMQTGYWYKTPMAPGTTATRVINQTAFTPIFIPFTTTLDRIGITAGSTFSGTASVRLGIFNTTNGEPSTVLLDAGTVAPAAANASYAIIINQSLSPGLYWLASNTITAAATSTFYGVVGDSINNINPLLGSIGRTTLGTVNYGTVGFVDSVSASSGFSTVSSLTPVSNNMYFVYVRVA